MSLKAAGEAALGVDPHSVLRGRKNPNALPIGIESHEGIAEVHRNRRLGDVDASRAPVGVNRASTSTSLAAVKAISPPPPRPTGGFTPSRRHKPSLRPGAAGSMAKVGEDSIAPRPRIEA